MSLAYHIDPDALVARFHGNPQALMQAAVAGQIDPTAAVIAGMKIKAAQNQQAMQGSNPTTVAQDTFAPALPPVAQQVMGGVPPVPSPSLSGGGLGATAQAAPPMAPTQAPMQAPIPMPEEAPMGMADGGMVPPYAMGGLDGIPVPDTMFDENRNGGFNDGYAGGGLVAFAGGGPLGPWFEEQAVAAIPGVGITSRQRSAAKNAAVGGTPNSYHLTNNARDFVPPKGMSMAQLHSQLSGVFGQGYDVINEGDHIHVEPGGKKSATQLHKLPTRKLETPEGQARSIEDFVGVAKKMYGGLPDAGLGRLREYYEKSLDPKEQRKQRKKDMWMALTQIGASMASTKSPDFLQAVGGALADALPGVAASKKERKEAERDALKALTDIYGFDRKEGKEVLSLGVDMQRAAAAQQSAAEERKWRTEQAAIGRRHDITMEGIRAQNAEDLARVQGDVLNTADKRDFAVFRKQLMDRIAAGMPLMTPDGKVVTVKGGGRPAESEIDALAAQWVQFNKNQYRTQGQTSLFPSNPSNPATGGTSTASVVDVNYGGM